MERIEKTIEVNAPITTVYNQWTQFEEFPHFMEGVTEVRQLDDDGRLFWRAQIAGKEIQWEAEIYEQIPDSRIAWRSITGTPNAGAVNFQSISPDRTRVTLVMEYQPMGAVEKIADVLGLVSSRVQGDLERFKSFIEERGSATGAWRGAIRDI